MRSELQDAVIKEAIKELSKRGINQVCTDELASDEVIKRDFQGCVDALVDDTIFWEL